MSTTCTCWVGGKRVLIIGYGWCGTGISQRFRALGAVTMVCEDVGQVGSSGGEGDIGIGDIIKGALDTKVINAAEYVL